MIKDNSPEQPNGRTNGNAPQNGERFSSQVYMAAKPSNRDEDEQRKHNFAALLSAARRGWRIAVPLGLGLAGICSLAAWKFFVPKYSASAYLRIDAADRPLIFKTADEAASRGGDFQLYKNTHQQLLLTPFVLNTALRDPEVSGLEDISSQLDAISWLQNNLKVTFPSNGEIMQVTMETVSPTSCVKIVNGVVDAFMKEVVVNERNERLARLNTLEKVFSERTNQVRNKQVELKNLATTLGTSDSLSLTVAQQSALQQFGKMQEKLSEVQFELMQAEGQLKIAQEFDARQKEADASQRKETSESLPNRDMSTLAEVGERTADVIRLEEDIEILESKKRSLSKSYGPSHFDIVRVQGEIDVKMELLSRRKAEAKLRSKLAVEEKQQADQRQNSQDQQNRILRTPNGSIYDLMGLAAKADVLTSQEKTLREKVELLSEETRQLGRSSIDVELMRSEISGLENILKTVGEEIERTSVELKTASRIRLLSSAVSATSPDSMKRLTRTVALGTFGLMAPFGLIALWDLTRKRVNTVEGTSQSLSLPTIGVIPLVARNPLQPRDVASVVERDDAQVKLDEAVDGLASMILHSSQIDKRKVFMISSALPSEGKSTVACQLSQSLARAGKSVALIDFDLRRPSIHRYLGLSMEPGVSESLYGFMSFEDAFQKTNVDNLSVMTAGDWNGNLHERCTASAVTDLFEYLRSTFDLVIVDSSPVLPVHDARVIGKYTDGVILTLVRDKSRLPAAAQACEILNSYGIPVLGTVIIGGNTSAYPSYYSAYTRDVKPKRLPASST